MAAYTRTKKMSDAAYFPTRPANEAAVRTLHDGMIDEVYQMLQKDTADSSGAHYINVAPIAGVNGGLKGTIFAMLSSLKTMIDNVVLGQIPDNTLTDAKLSNAAGAIKGRVKDIEVNVKEYGAKGDGITDDTQAIINALAENNTVSIKGGTFLVSSKIRLDVGKCIKGDKTGTILIGNGPGFTVFELTYKNEIYGFNISQPNAGWEGNIFSLSSASLQGTDAPEFVNLRVKIHDLDCLTSSGTFYELSCYKTDETSNVYTVYGMWNSLVYNINIKGYIEYFCRTWCYKPTGSTEVPWINANNFNNIVCDYPGYGWFGSKSLTTMSDAQYFNGNINVSESFMQCYTDSKNFMFISGGSVSVCDSIPYDWGQENTTSQNAFLLRNVIGVFPEIYLRNTYGSFDMLSPSSDDGWFLDNCLKGNYPDISRTILADTKTAFYIGASAGGTYPQYKRIARFKNTATQRSCNFRVHPDYSNTMPFDVMLTYSSAGVLTCKVDIYKTMWLGDFTLYHKVDADGYVNIYMSLPRAAVGWYIESVTKPSEVWPYGFPISVKDFGSTLDTTGMTLCTPTRVPIYLPKSSEASITADTNNQGMLVYNNTKHLLTYGRSSYGETFVPIVTTQQYTSTAASETITLSSPKSGLTPKIIIQPLSSVTLNPYPTSISMANQNFVINNAEVGKTYLIVAIYNEL